MVPRARAGGRGGGALVRAGQRRARGRGHAGRSLGEGAGPRGLGGHLSAAGPLLASCGFPELRRPLALAGEQVLVKFTSRTSPSAFLMPEKFTRGLLL